jgi:hypothetical protein
MNHRTVHVKAKPPRSTQIRQTLKTVGDMKTCQFCPWSPRSVSQLRECAGLQQRRTRINFHNQTLPNLTARSS